jgi:ArsR family transcriptional regulator
VIDTREIESIADPRGEKLAGRADVSVSLLAAVADPIRWTVLERLATQPSCVCRLQEDVPIAASLLSYHLKVLREAGLVTTSRRGRWIDYALADDALDRLRAALPGVVTSTEVCREHR